MSQIMLNVSEHRKLMNDFVTNHPELVEKCTKLGDIVNILYPAFTVENYGLFAMFVKPLLITAEKPDGHFYNPNKYQILARIVKGEVLFPTDGDKSKLRVDAYAWENEVTEEKLANGIVKSLNVDSEVGIENVESLLATIKNGEHRDLLHRMFYYGPRGNLLSVEPPAEKRYCLTVTEEIKNFFPNGIVDRWVNADENGLAPATNLELGDRIIIVYENDGSVTAYRCEKDIYLKTHIMGH